MVFPRTMQGGNEKPTTVRVMGSAAVVKAC